VKSEEEVQERLAELRDEQIDSEQIENDATRRRYMRYQLAIEQLEWVLDE